MVRDTPDSPHLGLEAAKAEVYLGWAHEDPTAPVEQFEPLPLADLIDLAEVVMASPPPFPEDRTGRPVAALPRLPWGG